LSFKTAKPKRPPPLLPVWEPRRVERPAGLPFQAKSRWVRVMTTKVRTSIAIAIFALAWGGIAALSGNEFFAGIFTVEALAAGFSCNFYRRIGLRAPFSRMLASVIGGPQ
jgi:hypothetical protein